MRQHHAGRQSEQGREARRHEQRLEGEATILVGERLEVRNHGGQVRVLRRSARQ
jgi:hypothetical protein